MSTSLQVSSLAYKCVFYGPEHNAIVDPMELSSVGLEMQK